MDWFLYDKDFGHDKVKRFPVFIMVGGYLNVIILIFCFRKI